MSAIEEEKEEEKEENKEEVKQKQQQAGPEMLPDKSEAQRHFLGHPDWSTEN